MVVDARPAPEPRLTLALADVPATAGAALPQSDGSSIFVRRARRRASTRSTGAARTWAARSRSTTPAAFAARATAAASTATASRSPARRKRRSPRWPPRATAIACSSATRPPSPPPAKRRSTATTASSPARCAASRRSSAPAIPRSAAHVAGLGEADPYVVWRLWLDKPTAPGRLPFYTTSRFRFTDSLAIYSAFQEPFVSWARRTGGSVVEVHAYAIAPEAMVPAAEIRAAMWRELVALLPELAGARVLHDEFQQQSNFTRWAPGDHAHRPAHDHAGRRT